MISCQPLISTPSASSSAAAAAAIQKTPSSISVKRCDSLCPSISDEMPVTVLQPLDAARLQLEQRVRDGAFIVGDSTIKVRLIRHIGGGSFGDVYLGLTDNGTEVAVKVELSESPSCARCLLHEGGVYRKLSGCVGIPNVVWYGMHGSEYSVLAMDLLGPTLYSVWTRLGQRFSMSTLLTVVDQTLEVISNVHSRGYIHRDISPSNFMLGSTSSERIHLIDFGQAKKASVHVVPASRHRFSFTRPIVGTPRFVSVYSHAGSEPSYRDDMEALGYMWIYLAKGRLPWQGIRDCSGPEKIGRIGQMKMTMSLEDLCDGLPGEFAEYMTYVRRLRQLDFPNHDAVRRLFHALADRLQLLIGPDHTDWVGLDLSGDPDSVDTDADSAADDDHLHLDSVKPADSNNATTPVSK